MNRNILHWSYRDFHEFPNELTEYADSLEEIYLKENFIPVLPAWFFRFIHLKFIQLSGNLLEEIPDEISQLENLEYLDVSKNRLKGIPYCISHLNKLQHLNVSDNYISILNEEIGRMKKLETLNICKNQLTRIPLELAESTSITELYFNDNQIYEIPTKIMSMPQLKLLEAERCALQYLPGIISNGLLHIRIFNNPRLTHYPIIYEKFLSFHYDYWSEGVVSADLLMIFLPTECKRTIIPRGIDIIRIENSPMKLFEYALRELYKSKYHYDKISLDAFNIPWNVFEKVSAGPVGKCGNEECNVHIFSECHFALMKKSQSPSHAIFSNMFCSKCCSDVWQQKFKKKYRSIIFHR